MKRTLLNASLTFLIGIISLSALSQGTDPVLLQVANEKVTKNEFVKVFEKNNIKGEKPDNKAIEEYLDLYINFRLKVTEAKNLGMDTIKSFRDELAGYRKQLAQPYLADNEANERLLKEAYDRKRFDIRASHILVRVDKMASAADTLVAWNKIMQIRNGSLKGKILVKLQLMHPKIHRQRIANRKDKKFRVTVVTSVFLPHSIWFIRSNQRRIMLS
jgi:peptidyl-prolyl cis-trans isomerase SurA